jgi:lipopolysaccharide export system permease protein
MRIVKIVDRLVLRELMGPLINSIFMFLVLLFTSAYLAKLTDLMVQGASFSVVARVGLLTVPLLLTQTLPMGMLLGTILAMGRLSGDSEHIALYACGVSFYRVARPVAVMGACVGLAAVAWNETIVPPATQEMYRLQQSVIENLRATTNPLRYDIKKKGSEEIDEIIYIHGGYDPRAKALRHVNIIKMSETQPGTPEVHVYAQRAVARDAKGLDWDFYGAYVKYLRPDKNQKFRAETYYERVSTRYLPENVRLGRDFKGIMQADITDNRRLTFRQLRDKIKEKRAKGDETYQADEFDLWSKISLPLASLIFGLVALPLGVRPQRGNKTMGFGIAISIIFIYWVVHQWMYQVAKGGQIEPAVAAFAANGIGLLAAVFLIARTRQ